MMDAVLARYLEGDLSAEEAEAFLAALEADPALEARLAAHERLLVAARRLPSTPPPAGFADAVMERVRRGADLPRRAHRAGAPTGLRRTLVAAAAAVLLFLGGFGTAHLGGDPASVATPVDGPRVEAVGFAAAEGAGRLHLVRLVHVPSRPGVEEVSVAGTFTGWSPDRIAMHRQDGAFTAVLLLPEGSYEYMFVEDGDRWVTDPGASLTRDDGFGQRNAVLDLGV
jgi:anti-sigma factor RsiW